MSLLPTTRFAIVLKDGRHVQLRWDMGAIFAREEDQRMGEKITLLRTIFHMTRTADPAPTMAALRESFHGIAPSQSAALLKAIGATKVLGETGGVPIREDKAAESSGEFDWRKAIARAVGLLEISLPEFWQLTPFEFSLRLEAALEQRSQHRGFIAQMTANLMNVSGRTLRRDVTGDELLGKPRAGDNGMPFVSQMGPQDKQAAIDRIWDKVQRQREQGTTPGGTA